MGMLGYLFLALLGEILMNPGILKALTYSQNWESFALEGQWGHNIKSYHFF